MIDLSRALALHLEREGVRDAQREADGRTPSSMEQFVAMGDPGLESAREALDFARSHRDRSLLSHCVIPAAEVHIHAPLVRPGKILCVGLNYREHADEAKVEAPAEPAFFSKFTNTIVGPGEPILLPRVSEKVDWEGELVVVVGRGGRYIPRETAMEHVYGYTIGNDVSARDWQHKRPARQWLVGKSFDTFLPLGPAIVTADEVPNPHELHLSCSVNGEVMQESNTSRMIFYVADLLSYISQVVTLEPGDIMLTGTPSGVGWARTPPRFLQDGDTLVTAIEGLGVLTNPVKSE